MKTVGEPHPAARVDTLGRAPGYYVPGTDRVIGYTLTMGPGPKASYTLHEQFEYVRPNGETFVVPQSGAMPTDLASIPPFASWLVPKDSTHTQPALLHDAMIVRPGERQDYIGRPNINDEEADQIFREGMTYSGVGSGSV